MNVLGLAGCILAVLCCPSRVPRECLPSVYQPIGCSLYSEDSVYFKECKRVWWAERTPEEITALPNKHANPWIQTKEEEEEFYI